MLLKISFQNQIHLVSSVTSYSTLVSTIRSTFSNVPELLVLTYTDNQQDLVTINSEEDFKVLQSSSNSFRPIKVIVQKYQPSTLLSEPLSSEKTGFFEVIEDDPRQDQIPQSAHTLSPQFSEIKSSSKSSEKEEPIEEKSKNDSEVIHLGIRCDSCLKKDIVGCRYKCTTCQNYNICQKCEPLSNHSHPFIKLKSLNYEQKPSHPPNPPNSQPKEQHLSNQLIDIGFSKKSSQIDFDNMEFGSKQQKNEVLAQYLSSIVGSEPEPMLRFVEKNQGLNASQLATKWFEGN